MTRKIYTLQEIKNIFAEHNHKLLSIDYINNEQKLRVLCSCGRTWQTSLNNFQKLKNKICPNCRTNPTKYTLEQVRKMFMDKGYVPNFTEYINNKTPLDCYCPCGEPMKVSLNDMLRNGYECKICLSKKRTGKNNPNYNPNLTKEDRNNRKNFQSPEDKEWSRAIKKIDDYTCQICGKRGGNLNSHHLYNYAAYPELRLDLRNGKTLCRKCHLALHKEYGFKVNTAIDYLRYKNGKDCIIFDFASPFTMKAYTPENFNKECKKYNDDVYNVDVKQFLANQKKEEKKTYHYNSLSSGYSKNYFNSIN